MLLQTYRITLCKDYFVLSLLSYIYIFFFFKVVGRIIHVNPKTKQIGVSFQPELLNFKKNLIDSSFKVGEIIECEVVGKSKSYGLLVKLPNEQYGTVHVSVQSLTFILSMRLKKSRL